MADTSPLIRIKAALASLRSECRAMDTHLGALGAAVMQSRVRTPTPTRARTRTLRTLGIMCVSCRCTISCSQPQPRAAQVATVAPLTARTPL
jgi:hypothetical protein